MTCLLILLGSELAEFILYLRGNLSVSTSYLSERGIIGLSIRITVRILLGLELAEFILC